MITLYNSLTRKKERLVPADGKTIKMYVCGPTVYNYFHVGNARCFVVFDFLRRYFEYKGYSVVYVQNFTDIDDKMIRKAAEEGVRVSDVADTYIAEYFTDARGLGIMPATIHPRATEHIGEMIKMIAALESCGYAYAVFPAGEKENKDVYFSAKAFDGYGKLSHMKLSDLEDGARVEPSDIKKEPMDFALWKAAKPGEPSFESPWGRGRPGWHIECSAMAKKHLGETIDIHCGGQDLIFPHHENEIAQSEAYERCGGHMDPTFARFWLHNGYINIDGAKMSKSGTSFRVRDAAKVYGYGAIRFFLLSAHYRNPVSFSQSALKQAQSSLQRIRLCEDNLRFRLKAKRDDKDTDPISNCEKEGLRTFETRRVQMCEALDDDFNTADAVAAIFELTRDVNITLQRDVSAEFLEKTLAIYCELIDLFGFGCNRETLYDQTEIEEKIVRRAAAKQRRDFAEADQIRDQLKGMGIILEDTPQGTKWRRE